MQEDAKCDFIKDCFSIAFKIIQAFATSIIPIYLGDKEMCKSMP